MKVYHDTEWGVPTHDDRVHFEFLMLECLQCGLSWQTILNKRDILRMCFDNFDYNKIASYTPDDVQRIMNTEGMIRSQRKIEAIIKNAKLFISICKEFGTFSEYIWGYTNNKTILYKGHERGRLPAKNSLSEEISKDLKKRGFSYLGPVTIYAYLQSCGLVNDHGCNCSRYRHIIENYPVIKLEPAGENA